MSLHTEKDVQEFDVVLQECPDVSTLIMDQRLRFEFHFLDEKKQDLLFPILAEGCAADGFSLDANLWSLVDNSRDASTQDLKDTACRRSFSSSGYGSQYSVSSDDSETPPKRMSRLSLQDTVVKGVNCATVTAAAPKKVLMRIVGNDALVLGGARPLNNNQSMRDYLESTIACY